MKTKITLGMVGMLLGFSFVGSVLTISAAEAAVVSPVSSGIMLSRADVVTLQTSLDALKGLLIQLDSELRNGQVAATQYAGIGVMLSGAQANLSVLQSTLATATLLPSNLAQAEIQPMSMSAAPEKTQISADQNNAPVVESFPTMNPETRATLFSVLTPKTAVGIVLGVGLIAIVVYSLRKKTKVAVEKMLVEKPLEKVAIDEINTAVV